MFNDEKRLTMKKLKLKIVCYWLIFNKFIFLPNRSIRVCVKGKRINRGVGYGLEIPTEYIFYGK